MYNCTFDYQNGWHLCLPNWLISFTLKNKQYKLCDNTSYHLTKTVACINQTFDTLLATKIVSTFAMKSNFEHQNAWSHLCTKSNHRLTHIHSTLKYTHIYTHKNTYTNLNSSYVKLNRLSSKSVQSYIHNIQNLTQRCNHTFDQQMVQLHVWPSKYANVPLNTKIVFTSTYL